MSRERPPRLRTLLAALLVPAFATCATDTEKSPDETGDGVATDASVTTEGGDPDGGSADASLDALSDGSESGSQGDATDAQLTPDVSPDADANVGPLILSYLAFCYQGSSGGLAVVYGIDDRTGALLHVDQDATDAGTQNLPSGPNTIFSAVSPARGALYCARSVVPGVGPSVGAFSIGDGGVLSPRASGAMAERPVSVAVHPSGGAVYALGDNVAADGIYSFSVAPNGGVSAGAYAGWGQYAEQLVVDRLGRFVFAAGSGTVWVHLTSAVDAGALSLAQFHLKDGGGFASFYVGDLGSVNRWVAHPTADAIYGLFEGTSDKVVAFRYDATSGSPAKLNELPADDGPVGIAVHPSGEHAYVVHKTSATIGHYTVASDGSLSSRTAVPIAMPATVVTMDPTGKYLYVGTATELRGFEVSASGGLTPLPSGSFSGLFSPDLATLLKP